MAENQKREFKEKFDYIKFYENYFNIKIPKNFEIHHLDFNRNNNNIDNLLMLPKWAHIKYHIFKPKIEDLTFEIEIKNITNSGYNFNEFFFEHAEEFIKAYRECSKWKDYKEFLLGNIPNIHSINLKDYE